LARPLEQMEISSQFFQIAMKVAHRLWMMACLAPPSKQVETSSQLRWGPKEAHRSWMMVCQLLVGGVVGRGVLLRGLSRCQQRRHDHHQGHQHRRHHPQRTSLLSGLGDPDLEPFKGISAVRMLRTSLSVLGPSSLRFATENALVAPSTLLAGMARIQAQVLSVLAQGITVDYLFSTRLSGKALATSWRLTLVVQQGAPGS